MLPAAVGVALSNIAAESAAAQLLPVLEGLLHGTPMEVAV